MLKRQTSGSIVCPSCHQLISVQVKVCPHCNRQNPSLWAYSKALRSLGADLVFFANIDNWVHLGGFVGGLAITRLPWFSPRKGESHWQVLAAIACLLITVLSLIASLGQGIWLIN